MDRREVAGKVPERQSFLDFNATWFGQIAFRPWESPGSEQTAFLVIETRPSAVLNVLFHTQSEDADHYFICSPLLQLFCLLSGFSRL